jgi:hypothetical protein
MAGLSKHKSKQSKANKLKSVIPSELIPMDEEEHEEEFHDDDHYEPAMSEVEIDEDDASRKSDDFEKVEGVQLNLTLIYLCIVLTDTYFVAQGCFQEKFIMIKPVLIGKVNMVVY